MDLQGVSGDLVVVQRELVRFSGDLEGIHGDL